MSVFRYPGSKGKAAKVIANRLINHFTVNPTHEYREPFFGAGAIGFELLKNDDLKCIWFNDRDPAICAVWNAIARHPEALKSRLVNFQPSVQAFSEYKDFLLGISDAKDINKYPLTEIAFKKIACHQMSYSGLGTMSGVLGGAEQKSKYPVDCRYSPKNLVKKIDQVWGLIKDRLPHKVDLCTCLDFEQVISTLETPSFLYLDPPYYEKGPALYQFSFSKDDHARLAAALRSTDHAWLLSYDNHPEVISLYEGWSDIDYLEFIYTINAHKGGVKKQEVLISSKNFQVTR